MACCTVAKSEGKDALPENADWMGELPVELHTVPLNSIAIPGSHDSFSATITKESDLAPNCPPFVKPLVDHFGHGAKEILLKWSVTQSLTFTQQLEAGIRYFDLRITTKTNDTSLYMCHALYTEYTVETYMQEIAGFLEQHPREVVLLDFNHFYAMGTSHHQSLLAMLSRIFGSKLCPLLDCDSVTLEQMWENKLQVIIFYHDEVVSSYLEFWPGSYIPSPWGDVYSVGKLLSFLDERYSHGRPDGTFYVSQGILTPDTSYILKHIFGSLKDDLASKASGAVVNWLCSKKTGPQGINIVILDFVEMADYINTVIALNSKPK